MSKTPLQPPSQSTVTMPASQAREGMNPLSDQLKRALRILRMKQLIERTNLSRATLYVLMATDPTFPRKVKLTARSVGFLESDVDAWIASRAQLCASV